MTDRPPNRSSRVMDVLAADDEKPVESFMRNLLALERAASTKPSAIRHRYLVNYRVSNEPNAMKVDGAERRRTLVALIEALDPFEHHHSTSTFLVEVHIASAEVLCRALAGPIDIGLDFISVAEITADRHAIGNSRLES